MTERLLPYPEPPLRDDAIVLRRWREDDLACVERASADPHIPEGTTVPAVWSPEEGMAYIRRQWERHTSGQGISLAIADAATDEAFGHINAFFRPTPDTVSIGYWLLVDRRGQGLGSRAVRLWSRWLMASAGLHRVEAMVEPFNTASQRVLEKAGFRQEGLLRDVLSFEDRRADAYLYALLPRDLAED